MYLDTSILVKLYVAEPDSVACSEKVSGVPLASSELAYAEMWAALLAKEKAKHISAAVRERAWEAFLGDIREDALTLFPLNFATLSDATEVMLEVHPHVPLRTLDAVHLATFRGVDAGPLFTGDKRMQAAARFLEFPLVG
ncbi:MAG: type II toxin-antitoxin system VapC family toxin [Opitutaceae bacterium]